MEETASVDPAFEYQFRVILIGDSMVGKSSLLKYFTEGRCPDVCEATVGVDFFAKVSVYVRIIACEIGSNYSQATKRPSLNRSSLSH